MGISRFGQSRDCGAVRTFPGADKVLFRSGRAEVEVQYLAPGESYDYPGQAQYAWTIWVDGRRVNAGGIPVRHGGVGEGDARDEAGEVAKVACEHTIVALWEGGGLYMCSGMGADDFRAALEVDARGRVVVRNVR